MVPLLPLVYFSGKKDATRDTRGYERCRPRRGVGQ